MLLSLACIRRKNKRLSSGRGVFSLIWKSFLAKYLEIWTGCGYGHHTLCPAPDKGRRTNKVRDN